MFRLWGKTFSNNNLIKDTVIEDSSDDTRTHKINNASQGKSVMNLTSEYLYGLIITFLNLKGLPKPDSTVIVLWKVLILIIWKYR